MTRWLAALVWASVIFALSSVSSLDTGLGTFDFLLRKLAHVSEYAILGALLAHALRERDAVAVGIGILYAVSDELHQHFVPGRVGSPLDVAIDGVGVVLGVVAYRRMLLRTIRA